MEFLTNNICKFEILNNHHLIKNNINIIVSVFFKRDQYYKNFRIYIKGLQRVIAYIDSTYLSHQFIYILFIDQNIADDIEIMKIINKCKYCVPVLFKCAKYMKDSYHFDVFGSMVRFFPMFDFPNNPCNIVICIDIDLHAEDYQRLTCLLKHKFKDVTGAADISKLLYHNLKPYTYAGLLSFNRSKINYRLIIDFIRDAGDGKIESKGHYGKRLTDFGYGIDEIFLNDVFLTHIGKINVIIDYQISYFLFHSKPYILEDHRIEKTSDILSTIIEPYLEPNMSIEQKFNFIDKNTYHIRERTKINNDISIRFTKIIEYLIESKKTWMESQVQHFIYKYLKHIISANLVIYTDYKNGIIDAIPYETIYDTEYTSE